MQIRPFKSQDTAQVRALISSVMNKEFSQEAKAYQYGDLSNILKAYGSLRERFLVVEENSEIIGTVGIKEDNDSTALLRRLFTHPSHRQRGIGSMLVDTAFDFCKMNNYKQIIFKATSNMTAAIDLLVRKKGFAEKERCPFNGIEIVTLCYKIH